MTRVFAVGALLLALSLPSFAGAQGYNTYFNDLRPCPPGTHSESFPAGSGYRCVVNE